eukprot:scaffold310122_cov41-Attheya_sp.AAC.1
MSNKAHRTPVFVNNAANLSALSTSLACFSVGIERHAKEATQFVDGAWFGGAQYDDRRCMLVLFEESKLTTCGIGIIVFLCYFTFVFLAAGKKNGGKGPSSISMTEARRHRDRAKSFIEEQQGRVNEVEEQLIQQTDEALNFTRLNE